jgi:hypothetical protein
MEKREQEIEKLAKVLRTFRYGAIDTENLNLDEQDALKAKIIIDAGYYHLDPPAQDRIEAIPLEIVCSDMPCGYPRMGQDCPYTDKRFCPIYTTSQIMFKKSRNSQPVPPLYDKLEEENKNQKEWVSKWRTEAFNNLGQIEEWQKRYKTLKEENEGLRKELAQSKAEVAREVIKLLDGLPANIDGDISGFEFSQVYEKLSRYLPENKGEIE